MLMLYRSLSNHSQLFLAPVAGWKTRGKRRMRDIDYSATLSSKTHAEDAMLPSFELAEMLTSLTLDESEHCKFTSDVALSDLEQSQS